MLPVAIVGGGPVGLFLALCLRQFDVKCRIFEQRQSISNHSRSIGIHPVSLELFARLGLSADLLARGVRVTKGLAFNEQGRVGELRLSACGSSFPFVLIFPQNETERLLEARLVDNCSDVLTRGVAVTGLRDKGGHIEIESVDRDGCRSSFQARFVVGCDGKRSVVRESVGIPFHGGPYPDRFIMGDFDDNTAFGQDAVIFLHSYGLIESFPLPFHKRRWVVRAENGRQQAEMPPQRDEIEVPVRERTSLDLRSCCNHMVSRFQAEKYLAPVLYRGRTVVAGDAAHIVSPIGGQGLNLGWLGAWRLAQQVRDIVHRGVDHETGFGRYSVGQRRAAVRASRRAELNMSLGRQRDGVRLRNSIVRLLLQPPVNRLTARLFTMHGLYSWPV